MSNEKPKDTLPNIDELWDYKKPAETAKKFKALFPKAKLAPAYYAELLTQVARTQSLQCHFEQAHQFLDEAQGILTDEMVIPQIRYHLERGRTYNSANEKASASKEFLKAFELAQQANADYHLVDAAHMLGISEAGDKQLEWNLKALDLAEKSKDNCVKKWLGPLYNNIGWSYHDMGQFDKALDLFEKSLSWRLSQNDKRGTFIAKWTIGRTLRSLNQIEEAIDIHQTLVEEIETGISEADGYVYEELAECLYLEGKTEAAKIYFKEAHRLLSQDAWLQKNAQERLERLNQLSV